MGPISGRVQHVGRYAVRVAIEHRQPRSGHLWCADQLLGRPVHRRALPVRAGRRWRSAPGGLVRSGRQYHLDRRRHQSGGQPNPANLRPDHGGRAGERPVADRHRHRCTSVGLCRPALRSSVRARRIVLRSDCPQGHRLDRRGRLLDGRQELLPLRRPDRPATALRGQRRGLLGHQHRPNQQDVGRSERSERRGLVVLLLVVVRGDRQLRRL